MIPFITELQIHFEFSFTSVLRACEIYLGKVTTHVRYDKTLKFMQPAKGLTDQVQTWPNDS